MEREGWKLLGKKTGIGNWGMGRLNWDPMREIGDWEPWGWVGSRTLRQGSGEGRRLRLVGQGDWDKLL